MINFFKNISAKQLIQFLIFFRFIYIVINIFIGESNFGNFNTIFIGFLVIYFLFEKEKIFFKYLWIFYGSIYTLAVYYGSIRPYFMDANFRIVLVPSSEFTFWNYFIIFDLFLFLFSIFKILKVKFNKNF
jgi:hypothetical protein